MKQTLDRLPPFLQSYLIAAYWTNDDDAPSGDYLTSSRPEIMNRKLSPEAFLAAQEDCDRFQSENFELIKNDLSKAGQDFWLTRNGNGAGFWGGDWDEDVGEILTKASKKFGSVDLYIGNDCLLYFS
jgi:hypothetical protein